MTATLDRLIRQAERRNTLDALRELLPPGTVVYTILRHVSRSGMSRVIDAYTLTPDGPRCLRGMIADVLDYKVSRTHDGLVVGGGGMDMGFALVYALSSRLYPTNPDRSDDDGGYTLTHRWL